MNMAVQHVRHDEMTERMHEAQEEVAEALTAEVTARTDSSRGSN